MKPLTYMELSEVYRKEFKAKSLTEVRKDLYPAMAELIRGLDADRRGDTILAEGASQQYREAMHMADGIAKTRARKLFTQLFADIEEGVERDEIGTVEDTACYNGMKSSVKGLIDSVSNHRRGTQ